MDKKQFVERAPIYYALAIVADFKDTSLKVGSLGAMQEFYSVPSEDEPGGSYSFIEKNIVLDEAVKWLVEYGILEEEKDDFGPSIFTLDQRAGTLLEMLEADRSLPFYKYAMLNRPQDWLRTALSSLNNVYDNLEIAQADFESPDREWDPLPLDRKDPALQKVIGALDDTIEQVRADNGYSATLPEERNYVLDGLSAVSKRLKEATAVSVPYLQKYALEPLEIVIRRFKDAALGVAAAAARQVIVEFLKEHGIKLLQSIFGS